MNSKEKKVELKQSEAVDSAGKVEKNMPALSMAPEALSDADRSALEIAKLNLKVSKSEAEKALAQNEAAETSFKYIILQLYMKYQLNVVEDAIGNDGKIMRGALLNQGVK